MTVTNTTSSTTTTGTSATSTSSSTNSLTQLASNFTDFLSLLTTQLQNQDPTSPMDTNQFTSQLVQFTSVQEQINTNATLGQLLTSTQGQQLSEASSLVGKTASINSTTIPLQNSSGAIDFSTTTSQPVQVTITDANNAVVRQDTFQSKAGANTWTWDGTNSSGGVEKDGGYTATVSTVSTVGTTGALTAVPFTAVGTVTGAEQVNGAVQLMFGTVGATFDKVVSFGAAAS